jgi:lipopolysaccharide/colanic/teichoic acid biosynthesis glycosyltransferase
MRLHLPTSRDSFKIRLSLFDAFWAIVSPLLALYFRDANILSPDGSFPTLLYCSLSLGFSLIAFAGFRIHQGMTSYFSVHDAMNVAKAVGAAALMTYVALFTFNRLEGIPRSLPLIHALILIAGLVGIRIFTRLLESSRTAPSTRNDAAAQNILMIGSNRLSVLYIKFIRAYSPGLHRIRAVLDDRPEMFGRAIDGVRIIGPTDHLEPVINEFAEHGVHIHHVIVGGDPDLLSESTLPEIRRICEEHQIRLDFIPELIGLQHIQPTEPEIEPERPAEPVDLAGALSSYSKLKRIVDVLAAVALLVMLSPLWIAVALVALLDVGSPILFWQQRLGQGGRPFLLQKIRTLKPPFDWRGRKVTEAERLSVVGRFLRKTRLDEFPQLLNVLVGDMSLIGPRPLLPRDQPPNPAIRLAIRPGITGWAQVNGGTALCVEEKDALDEWYIRNASWQLDARIILITFLSIFIGQQRSHVALEAAFLMRRRQCSTLEHFFSIEPANDKRTADKVDVDRSPLRAS